MKQFFIGWQYVLPQHLLSRLLGRLANCRCRWLKNRLIYYFITYFKVDLSYSAIEDYRQFATFNDFFTRSLKAGIRPVGEGVVSPVDGRLSALGQIEGNQIFQAKGHHYSLSALLGGDTDLAQQFSGGSFLTAYLAPRDYHWFHLPVSGRLLSVHYIPGRLFSVNPATVASVDGLFARNERVVFLFESEYGLFALIAVGAMVVGNIGMVGRGLINSPEQTAMLWDVASENRCFNKGDKLGYFQLGSTVIVLFQKDQVSWQGDLSELKVGQRIA